MDTLNYLLLVNIYLVLFYAFYALFLKNETFFKLNRIYLVGGACMSFLIPFLQSEWIRSLFITKQVEGVTQNIGLTQPLVIQAEETVWQTGEIIFFIYLVGAAFCLLRFLWQLYRVQAVLKYGESDRAFSFFSKVKVGSAVPNRDTVLGHEMVHARQWHSADVILFEIISIINWFNPVVYLYRKAIKHIHEFTADEIAAHNEESKAAYAMLLFSKTFGVSTHQLTNSFYNQSLLKRRIIMLHKSKSTKNALLKYGLSAPLFAGMMILSSATASKKIESIDPTLMMGAGFTTITTGDYSEPVLAKMPIATDNISVKETSKGQDTTLFTKAEVSPEFPGGMKAFYEYLGKNFKYPEEARKNKVSGKVILQFVVERDGRLTDVKVLRGLGSGLDEEAVRVLLASPIWKPGIQNGKSVRVAYTLPISLNTGKSGSTPNLGNLQDSNSTIRAKKTSENPSLDETIVWSAQKAEVSKDKETVKLYGKPSITASQNAFFMVNGKKYTSSEGNELLKNTSSNEIESITILNGESAIRAYGERGEKGVIQIALKKR